MVDYRALNRATARKFFLIPNADYIKSTVAGNRFISVGDLKEGFNQVDNEEETRRKMAVLSAGGCWLPRGLTFGATNGPEDFQELVFIVFQRRLYDSWFLFVDDLAVATGRKKCHKEGPSGAHDVSCCIRRETEGEKGDRGLGRAAAQAFPSLFAHVIEMTGLEINYVKRLVAKHGRRPGLHIAVTTSLAGGKYDRAFHPCDWYECWQDYWSYSSRVSSESEQIATLSLKWRKDYVWPTELADCIARRGFYQYARGRLGCQYHQWYRDLRQLSADEPARMGLILESGGGQNAGTGYGCFPETRWPEASSSLWWTWYLVRRVLGCPRRHVGRLRREQACASRE